MSFPILENYLARLPHSATPDARVWVDGDGRVQGRYFNCTVTSAFQPVRELSSGQIVGFEAFLRSYSGQDSGLSLWKLLDHAASDDESIELDRLCRMLHAINFYRQADAGQQDLYLSVHDRLLAAVSSNHGVAFRRILEGLGLPRERIVLQLPAIAESQGWLLNQVASNYRLNGFRVAVNARNAAEALQLLQQLRPDILKVDAREIGDLPIVRELLQRAAAAGIRAVFKRVESRQVLQALGELGEGLAQPVHVQGKWWDMPWHALPVFGLPPAASNQTQAPDASLAAV